jgi:hypothetical protein
MLFVLVAYKQIQHSAYICNSFFFPLWKYMYLSLYIRLQYINTVLPLLRTYKIGPNGHSRQRYRVGLGQCVVGNNILLCHGVSRKNPRLIQRRRMDCGGGADVGGSAVVVVVVDVGHMSLVIWYTHIRFSHPCCVLVVLVCVVLC